MDTNFDWRGAPDMHPSTFIFEEVAERGWTVDVLLDAMADNSPNESAEYWGMVLAMYSEVGPTNPKCRMGELTARVLDRAFGLSDGFWARMEESWLAASGDGASVTSSIPAPYPTSI